MAGSVVIGACILWYFHDVFWYGPDEGAYAHVADRILRGEVFSRDVQDIHAGYVNFANALAMKVFGETLVSMRYPLVIMGIVQAALIYLLVAPAGRVAAIIASTVIVSLSTVQFLNPTAHWYALFFAIVVIFVLQQDRFDAFGRLETIGFLLVTLFLFRQLSGVVASLGVVAWLIYRMDDRTSRNAALGRATIGIMTLGLAFYLVSKTDIFGFVLVGLWPLGILLWLLFATRIGDRASWRIIRRLGLGGVLALAPLVSYHLAHGSLDDWFRESFLTAVRLTELPFISKGWYGTMLAVAAVNIAKFSSLHEILNGVFWIMLLFAPVLLGYLTWRRLSLPSEKRTALPPLLFVPPFYALVSIHYQIPIYVFYSAGLTMVGLCFAASEPAGRPMRAVGLAACLYLSGVGLYYQAGQPLGRGLDGILAGSGTFPSSPCPSPRCGLRIDSADAALYRRLLTAIERRTERDDTILALPSNPELYFLTGRRNPFPFFNSALGIKNEAELATALARAAVAPPKLVIYRPADKYNTPLAMKLWDGLKPGYALVAEIDGFEVYRRSPGSSGTEPIRNGSGR